MVHQVRLQPCSIPYWLHKTQDESHRSKQVTLMVSILSQSNSVAWANTCGIVLGWSLQSSIRIEPQAISRQFGLGKWNSSLNMTSTIMYSSGIFDFNGQLKSWAALKKAKKNSVLVSDCVDKVFAHFVQMGKQLLDRSLAEQQDPNSF